MGWHLLPAVAGMLGFLERSLQLKEGGRLVYGCVRTFSGSRGCQKANEVVGSRTGVQERARKRKAYFTGRWDQRVKRRRQMWMGRIRGRENTTIYKEKRSMMDAGDFVVHGAAHAHHVPVFHGRCMTTKSINANDRFWPKK